MQIEIVSKIYMLNYVLENAPIPIRWGSEMNLTYYLTLIYVLFTQTYYGNPCGIHSIVRENEDKGVTKRGTTLGFVYKIDKNVLF